MHINKKSYFILLFVYLLLSYLIYFITDKETVDLITKEDGIVEWIGAFSWFIASIIFFYLFFKIESGNKIFTFKQNLPEKLWRKKILKQ